MKDFTAKNAFNFNRVDAEEYLLKNGAGKIRRIIGAYLEPPMNYAVDGTIQQGAINDDSDPGMPPKFITPQPLRTFTPDDLKHYEYPKFQTCKDLPAKLPIDRGLELYKNGTAIIWNVGNFETPENYTLDEAPFCPVDADPFLPWIHDVFPSHDGTVVEFIAHNRRRCKTGRKHRPDVLRMEPQVSLMQHVSVKRLTEVEASQLAPELWQSSTELEEKAYRYRLVPMEDASSDGKFTRFICRFYGTEFTTGKPRLVLLDENLSIYPYNYEFISYRKGKPTMITPKGRDNKYFWTSIIRFQCPVPENLQNIIKTGNSILSDGTPTLHVDLIPIRTPPRFGVDQMYLPEDMIGPPTMWQKTSLNNWGDKDKRSKGFNASEQWGLKNVLPRVEASGRWTNLPICQPSVLFEDEDHDDNAGSNSDIVKADKSILLKKMTEKPHLLSACLWASTTFRVRGGKSDGRKAVTDTGSRLREWIEFHLMVGFDHIYVFDNSGAHTNETSLAPIINDYPKSKISHIEWPSIICNNNIPAHDSAGERSSQYTAENSCRTRFAPFTEWIASFDTDEYLVPMGEHNDLRSVVIEAQKKGTNILTFRSSRGRLMYERSKDVEGGYREMLPNYTYIEAYNCDSSSIPKESWADRARKQIYRADYVPYHYVHYSTVTKGYMKEFKDDKSRWRPHYSDNTERVTDERSEAIMIHTKTTSPTDTTRWNKRCKFDFEKKWRGCSVGFAWPNGVVDSENNHTKEGFQYNCFMNERVENYWIGRLKEALKRRKNQYNDNNN
eukprot:CAMPEP_0194155296 /NCGR_PEP_ID=MMETSP0152-20130528/63899_1 /TAXON_ID=1049557 /ORGANISM="Thalassiothrix antarctica, Strain L6-D1" /LENGTH=779 /DNA_ID=CAMNT_0038862019 /DNA_START=212 /DNA_END=2551 /DNA_ORIENTATION=+